MPTYLPRTAFGSVANHVTLDRRDHRVLPTAGRRARRHRRRSQTAGRRAGAHYRELRSRLLLNVGRAARQRLLRDDLLRGAPAPGERAGAATTATLQNDLIGGKAAMVSAEPAIRIQRLARLAGGHGADRAPEQRTTSRDPRRARPRDRSFSTSSCVPREVRRSDGQRAEARERDAARRSASAVSSDWGAGASDRRGDAEAAGAAPARGRPRGCGRVSSRALAGTRFAVVLRAGCCATRAPGPRPREPAARADAPVRACPPDLPRARPPPPCRWRARRAARRASTSKSTRCWLSSTAARPAPTCDPSRRFDAGSFAPTRKARPEPLRDAWLAVSRGS